MLKFRDLSSTPLRQRQPLQATSSGSNDKSPNNLESLPEVFEPGDGNSTYNPENEEWENKSDTEGECLNDVSPEAVGLSVGTEHGVNLRSPTLLDLLVDQTVEGAQQVSMPTKEIRKTRVTKGQSSAKKDTTDVDLSSS